MQAHEQLPENLSKYCYLEFTMPHTTVSHTVCRSIAVPSCDDPPEKCVRYLSRHEYVVEIEHTQGFAPATYNLAASVKKEPEPAAPETAPPADPTDSWFPTEKPKADDDSDFSDD
ncbi:unnamed protein product [Allacma fusca]|uniref:Uncharacterized protein n=1 Tax=Allacma fusca TaxID=39272 RepID=A0A8J2L1I7_9HEXA|nr:unnamed protein product [Allacma fusca]